MNDSICESIPVGSEPAMFVIIEEEEVVGVVVGGVTIVTAQFAPEYCTVVPFA